MKNYKSTCTSGVCGEFCVVGVVIKSGTVCGGCGFEVWQGWFDRAHPNHPAHTKLCTHPYLRHFTNRSIIYHEEHPIRKCVCLYNQSIFLFDVVVFISIILCNKYMIRFIAAYFSRLPSFLICFPPGGGLHYIRGTTNQACMKY